MATKTKLQSTSRKNRSNWGIYAAAAGASLSMVTSADAGIIAGNLNITAHAPQASTPVTQNFSIAGVPGKLWIDSSFSSRHLETIRFLDGVKFFNNSSGWVRKYGLNAPISAGHHNGTVGLVVQENNGSFFSRGLRHATSSAYLGFVTNGGDLGWLKIELSSPDHTGYPEDVTLVDYAYDQTAGETILAGDTGVSAATPEPDSKGLALLAAGAMGVLTLRRRWAAKAK